MAECPLCDESGWHFRSGAGWQMSYPHGAVVTVEVEAERQQHADALWTAWDRTKKRLRDEEWANA
jgi:hypothetical protein